MGKDITTLPTVWIVTGIDYDDERVVLAVCPDKENAEKAKGYYQRNYDDIEVTERCQETYDEMPYIWSGRFNVTIRPYINHPNTYIMGSVAMSVEKKFLTSDVNPADYDNIYFKIVKTIDQDGKEKIEMYGNFSSSIELPAGGEGGNCGKARREWLAEKVNERGVIKLAMPTFD